MKKELKGLYDLCISKGIAESELKPYFATIESNLKTKRYGLVWEEQLEDIASDLKNKFPILVEREDLSIKADHNGLTNCLIEGDNYESLTFLKNSGVKVDCIYIDPPYNTGNQDFVYNDKYIDSEDTWRHSSWLSFMNKRLKLAKELLTEDGVIFISIDDNEQAQLKLLCDSIFGENNSLGTIIWEKKVRPSNKNISGFSNNKEYILCFSLNSNLKLTRDLISDKGLKSYSNPDNDPRGLWRTKPLWASSNTNKEKELVLPTGNILKKKWFISQETLNTLYENKEIYESKNGTLSAKIYLNENKGSNAKDLLLGDVFGTTESATNDLKLLFGGVKFNYPKPLSLISYLISKLPNKDITVLDFFAGSGTTGHAVLDLNKEDGGKRNFILCTNNEISHDTELDYLKSIQKVVGDSKNELNGSFKAYQSKDEYVFFKESDEFANLGICRSVTYERLKRVIMGYTTPKGKEVPAIPTNLKYYKVKNIGTVANKMETEDVLIENIVPFVQFKHNVWEQETVAEDLISLTNEAESIFVYSNTLYLCDGFYESINSSDKPTTLYIYDGLFEFLDEERLANVNILSITNEFYKN